MRWEMFTLAALEMRSFSPAALKALKTLPGSNPGLTNFGSIATLTTNFSLS
jgi:hypothetical protein